MGDGYFNSKNILLISPEGWDHLFVSKHHYAIELAKRNRVFFLNPPSKKYSVKKSTYDNLWIIDYKPIIKGLRFLPKPLRHYIMRKKFERIEVLVSTKFDCIWSFDNSVFFDFDFLPKKVLKISHIVDYSQNFEFHRAASTADICFGVSQNIVRRLLASNKNSFSIPHGISVDKFDEIDVALPGSNQIKALYAGKLDSLYLDMRLIYSLIENHPEVDFIFLGSGGADWPRKKNTYFLGVIKHEQLRCYLKKADILILFYNVEKYPDQLTNAHKILEYLAAGKVIVSTFISDYENMPLLLEMTKEKDELPVLFRRVVSNLSFFNSEERRTARMTYAESNNYSSRISEIEQFLEQNYFSNPI